MAAGRTTFLFTALALQLLMSAILLLFIGLNLGDIISLHYPIEDFAIHRFMLQQIAGNCVETVKVRFKDFFAFLIGFVNIALYLVIDF